MKTKNKLLALVEIAIVLCSVFFLALPAIAAEQTMQTQEVSATANTITTASEDDYVLDIYGNANEDDTIDMRDLTYVKLIFFGKKTVTELADAKYDGKINPLDFIQIKLIIVGKEKELTIVDSAPSYRIVTVKKPLKRIVSGHQLAIEMMRSLKLEKDRIVGVSSDVHKNNIFFPEFSDYPYVGIWPLDIEKVLSLNPDAVFLYPSSYYDEETKKLEDAGITVLRYDWYRPGNIYVEEVKKLGYIIDKEEEAEEFLEFYEGCMDTIKERVEGIPEDERPRIYLETGETYKTAGKDTGYHQKLEMVGSNNIFSDLSGYPDVDPEEVIKRNPEIILKMPYWEGGYKEDDLTVFKDMWNEIRSRPELESVLAVKNKRIYILSNDVSAAKHFIGISYMAKWFHPDIFKDLDPKAIHQEYLTRFQGLDYDLDKHGVFVYPEEHPDGK